METINFAKIDALKSSIGKELAVSDWMEISQADIDRFGAATGDDHWIYTDVTRASQSSPYGETIAQGYLTLCFLARFSREIITKGNDRICINYGLDRVRFPAPVKVGQRIRARLVLSSAHRLHGGGRATWIGLIEIENCEKPACYAELVSQWFNTSAEC